jgi:glycosyltransferase involved in cell wall biosynthesis
VSRRISIWLITVGEPLPIEGNRDRLWRTGLLAGVLAARGHDVLWWTSTVDHFRKRLFVHGEPRLSSQIGVPIQFLDGRLYRRNLSLNRLVNHAQIARRFATLAERESKPDLILCSFPTIELSREAVRYAEAAGVPVILDVRDLWPDAFLDVVPAAAKVLAKLALSGLFKDAERALSRCHAVLGVSDAYVRWGLTKGRRTASNKDRTFPLAYQSTAWSPRDAQAVDERLRASGAPLDLPLATFVGTFGRTYDLATVIEAEEILRTRRGATAHFVLCGAGERESEWRSLAGTGNVTFMGWLPAGELAYVMSKSAIGLAAYAPNAPQGIPNKVIEYLSASLPVLCCLPGECRALLESKRCGKHYEAGSAESLATAVESVLKHRDGLAAMRTAARELFEREFAATTVYGAMADHLERVAVEHSKPPQARAASRA